MKSTKRRHGFACLLCMVIVLLAAVPASAVSFTTDGFFTTLDVGEDSSMHVTEEIYVTFTSPGHGIYRQIPNSGTHSYFMHDGELVEAPLPYVIRNVKCEGQEVETDSEDGFLSVRIGSADVTVSGAQKYKLEYDIVMYEDGIDYLDQLYWNVIPAYWETDIDFAGFTVNMPKAFDASSADVITGPIGSGDDSTASWDVEEDGTVLAGHVDALPRREGVTVRIVLPEGYWTGVKSNAKQWWIAEGILGAITLLVLGLFLVKGRDPKTVKTVEFYPPENLSPAEIGYIYDNMVNDKDMTSLVMWFASKGYLKISAAPGEKKFLRKEQPIIILEKRRDLPADAPAYQKHFFDGLFEYGREANLKNLAVSTSFADSYEAAKESLQDRYGKTSPNRRLQEGQGYTAVGCLAGFIMLMVFGLATVFLYSYGGQFLKFLAVMVVCSIIVFLCVIHMSRPTPYRQKMLGRIQGFRDFIAAAELDRINQLVEQDPDYYYDILPYAYVFGLTDKWAKNFEALAPKAPDWYSGPDYYMMSPVVFCDSIGGSVRSSLSESAIHSTSASDFSGGSSGGGGFSGGGGGGGGGGGW